MLIETLKAKKVVGEKITMLTCYDYTFAKLLAACPVDMLLVGDSVGMVVYGEPNTHHVAMAEMIRHTAAVCRGNQTALTVADLPAGAYPDIKTAVANAQALISAGAQAVKLEGGREILPQVEGIIAVGIPVFGHVGLTPQTAEKFTVQGRDADAAAAIAADALALERAGVCGIVLEMIPAGLAQQITASLAIPTIGIGAGRQVDGQVLVLYDMLGLFEDFKPRFVKHFATAGEQVRAAVTAYCDEVRAGAFPDDVHSFR